MKFSLVVSIVGLLLGLLFHNMIIHYRAFVFWDGLTLQDHITHILLVIAFVPLIIGEAICLFRGAWLGNLLFPVTLYSGLFVVAGGL